MSGPRRQKSLKGCMGALPQMFQLSRMLGSNNKCIATTHADVQTLCVASEKQTAKPVVQLQIKGQQHRERLVSNESAAATASSSISEKVSERNASQEADQTAGMDLRHVLHAKQEPFVLQDVIREKRQPMRTHSSRELKFGAPSTRRSLKIRDQEQAAEDGASPSQYYVLPSSAAVVRRNRVPVESMVAMPSYQAPAARGVNSAKKAHSKPASQGRNPVKSPNKRALLMEAAARILEGSNRGISKRPSTSVRSLLEELEKSKHVKELSKPKEKLVRAVVLHSASSEREEVLSPNLVILGEKAKQHQNSYDLKLLGKHNSNSSCEQQFEMPQILEKDLLVMQNRVFPYDNALDEAEVLPSLAAPVQKPASENESDHVQLHHDIWSARMKGTQKETMNQIVRGFKLDSSELLLKSLKTGAFAIDVLPEVITTEEELDHAAFSKDSRAIVPSTSIDSAADFTPVTCLRPNFDNGTPSLIRIVLDYSVARHFTWGYDAAAPNRRSSARSTARATMKAMEAERQSSVMQLRLCNYSWWANSRQNNSHEKSGEKQLSTEYCAGYDSPVAARCPCFVKVWNADEEEACVCVEEFQQASPVSVLEPVYEEELELGNSFDNFEEARQKLLEKVRRYEMLADMDVDMLKKVSEWDDDDKESWETDDSCSSSSSPAAARHADHDFSSSLRRSDDYCSIRSKRLKEVAAYESLYGQEDVCLSKKLEPRPTSCRVLRLDEGELAPVQSGPSIVAYVVNSLLHKDLTKSNWSSSKQEEEEEVEVELETCFFDLLVCELLSDLLKAQFKPFCNAFDLCT